MEVQTLYNPAALDIPEVKAALSGWANGVEVWFEALKAQMSVGAATVIVGTKDDTKIDAAAIITLPQAFTDTLPWVVHFHNDGPRELTHLMVDATLAFIKQAGYNGYRALNQSGMTDKRWLRAFKFGGKPKFIGSAYIFDLNEGISDAGNSTDRRRNKRRAEPIRRRQGQKPKHAVKQQHAHRSNAAVVSTARANGRLNARKLSQRRNVGK